MSDRIGTAGRLFIGPGQILLTFALCATASLGAHK